MQIEYYGANCVVLSTKNARVVFDDTISQYGLKTVLKKDDIVAFTTLDHPKVESKFCIDTPGEYEISDISIKAIPARKHIDQEGNKAIIYAVTIAGVKVAVLGNVIDTLTESQQESLGMVDILVLPVGGSGYTLDPVGAKKIIKTISPKVFIPIHYADSKIAYEVPQTDFDTVTKELGLENVELIDTFKVKSKDSIDETKKYILLNNKS